MIPFSALGNSALRDKAPLLLAHLGNTSQLESTVGAMQTKNNDKFDREDVTSDLIEKWNQIKSGEAIRKGGNQNQHNNKYNNNINNG